MQQYVVGHELALMGDGSRAFRLGPGVQPTQLCERRGQLLIVELLAPLVRSRVQQAERSKARQNMEARDPL